MKKTRTLRRTSQLVASIFMFGLLSGCISIPNVPSGPFVVGPDYTLNLGRNWSNITPISPGLAPQVKVFSVDGPLLNRLYVAGGLAANEGLFRKQSKEKTRPVLKANMTGSDQIEFLRESVTALDFRNVEVVQPRPASLSGRPAIRVNLTARTVEGLEVSGTGIIQKAGERYNLLIFVAPREHYFGSLTSEINLMTGST
jgi:hypothetical protein